MVPQTPLNRAQLKAFADEKFLDNVLAAITPEDARDVIHAIIDSTGLVVEELARKADLVNGKVPTTQLPLPGASANIPAWSTTTTYALGIQVTFDNRIWESKINNNLNIEPFEGEIWNEVSPTHLQNTDTLLRLPNGTPLTAQYIVDNLGGKPVYKLLITIEPATDSVTVDPASLVPTEYDLAEIVFVRQSGVACTITIPGYEPVVIEAGTDKTFHVKILRFPGSSAGTYVYYCFPSLSEGAGVTDGDKTDLVVSGETWLVKASRILGQALTGLGSLTGEIVATDTIVQAFGKVVHFMSTIGATIRGTVMTGLDTNQAGAPAATDTLLQVIGKLVRIQNAQPTNPTSGTWAGTSVDFSVGYQIRTFSNEQVTINGFSNTSLGRKVRIVVTSTNAADTLAFSVAGWIRQDIGFPFVPGIVNIVEIHIVGSTTYETFITPVTV